MDARAQGILYGLVGKLHTGITLTAQEEALANVFEAAVETWFAPGGGMLAVCADFVRTARAVAEEQQAVALIMDGARDEWMRAEFHRRIHRGESPTWAGLAKEWEEKRKERV